jgi:hypothetical protein
MAAICDHLQLWKAPMNKRSDRSLRLGAPEVAMLLILFAVLFVYIEAGSAFA